jgi:Ca2+-binding RTX toxin-like protein
VEAVMMDSMERQVVTYCLAVAERTGFVVERGTILSSAGRATTGYGEKPVTTGYGESGDDTLIGGNGMDTLNGGRGNDVFDYNALSDSPGFEETSPVVIRDNIIGFDGKGRALGDRIDLSTIDANLDLAGNQTFHLNQLTYSGGILTATVIGFAIPGSLDLQVRLVGSPPLDLGSGTNDIVL